MTYHKLVGVLIIVAGLAVALAFTLGVLLALLF